MTNERIDIDSDALLAQLLSSLSSAHRRESKLSQEYLMTGENEQGQIRQEIAETYKRWQLIGEAVIPLIDVLHGNQPTDENFPNIDEFETHHFHGLDRHASYEKRKRLKKTIKKRTKNNTDS